MSTHGRRGGSLIRPKTKVAVTMTYEEWVALMRTLSYALNEMKDQGEMRVAEKLAMLSECRQAKDLLVKRIAEKIAGRKR